MSFTPVLKPTNPNDSHVMRDEHTEHGRQADEQLVRREYLKRAGALGGVAATTGIAGCMGGGGTSGKPDTLTLSTWGGSWQDLMIKAVVEPYQKETGINVNYVIGNATNRLSKTIAQQNAPADVAQQDGFGLVKGSKADAWHELNEDLVPTLSKIPKQFKADDWVLQIFAASALLYNPNVMESKPPGFSAYLNPKYKGKVGLFSQDPTHDLLAFSLYKTNGKSYKAIDKAFDMFEEVVKTMDPVYITSSEEYGKHFANGNIVLGRYWTSRAAQWNAQGKPVRSMIPPTGAVTTNFGNAIPKGIEENKLKWAGKFIDKTLQPHPAKVIARNMYYTSPNPTINYPDDIQKKLILEEALSKLQIPDFAWAAKHRTEWVERATRIINQYS